MTSATKTGVTSSTNKTTSRTAAARDVAAELAFLTRALKAPTLRDAVPRLAERARAESWSHEEFLVACLQREVSARESHGGEGRIRAARFPARKSLEEFDFDHARGLKRDVIAHLGTLDFVAGKENVVFLGPPGTGKTHCETVRLWTGSSSHERHQRRPAVRPGLTLLDVRSTGWAGIGSVAAEDDRSAGQATRNRRGRLPRSSR
jgi:hypothetical protein